MEVVQYLNQEKEERREQTNVNELNNVKTILLELRSRRNELFKSMNNETRQLCDKLIEYSLNLKQNDKILELVNEVFNDRQIYIPGSIGSFVINCVFNQKKKKQSINEEEKYSQYNFLFYHKIGDNEIFTPLRIEKENEKLIILLRESDRKSFNLGKNREKLKFFGVTSIDQVEVMNYNSSNEEEIKNEKSLPKKEKSIIFSILLVVVLLAIIFVIYLLSK